jgi:hypothetical protein
VDLLFGEESMKAELAILGRLSNRPAAKVKGVIADDIAKVIRGWSLEVDGQKICDDNGALKNQRCNKRVLHDGSSGRTLRRNSE